MVNAACDSVRFGAQDSPGPYHRPVSVVGFMYAAIFTIPWVGFVSRRLKRWYQRLSVVCAVAILDSITVVSRWPGGHGNVPAAVGGSCGLGFSLVGTTWQSQVNRDIKWRQARGSEPLVRPGRSPLRSRNSIIFVVRYRRRMMHDHLSRQWLDNPRAGQRGASDVVTDAVPPATTPGA